MTARRGIAMAVAALLTISSSVVFRHDPEHPPSTPARVTTVHVVSPTGTTTTATTTTAVPATTTSIPAPPPPTTAPPLPPAPATDIEAAIHSAFGADGPAAVRVARCESGLNPQARNGVHAGLFQISGRWHRDRVARMGFTWEQMYEAGPNIAVALAIFREQGWRPWTCRP